MKDVHNFDISYQTVLNYVDNGNPIYVLAEHLFSQNDIHFDINQVVGLTNKDEVSFLWLISTF